MYELHSGSDLRFKWVYAYLDRNPYQITGLSIEEDQQAVALGDSIAELYQE